MTEVGDESQRVAAVNALLRRGDELRGLGRVPEAVAIYDGMIERYARDYSPAASRHVAAALALKAFALRGQVSPEREIEILDELLVRYADTTDTDIRRRLAHALARKGTLLNKIGRPSEARTVWMGLLEHFQLGESPDIDAQIGSVRQAISDLDRGRFSLLVAKTLRPLLRRLTKLWGE